MSASQLPTARPNATDDRTSRRSLRHESVETLVVLGRYRLQGRLGAGAFGTVWLARDERLERDVAVKIVPRERIVGGRFEREARAAARLSHPGIVTLYEAGADDDGAYLVSELVRGATLDEMLDVGRLSDRDVVEIGIALCDALSHAHSQGVVHRDVKPSNVLIPERSATPAQIAKLTDFGVARVVGGDSLTRTGDVIGTAAYMAPEQAEGREAGAAADLYSLALVLYEALTGVNPIRTGTAAQRARRLGAHMPPLRRQRRDLPRELGQGIDLALRPRPRERGTVETLRASLTAALGAVGDDPGVVASPWRTDRSRIDRPGQIPGEQALDADAERSAGEAHGDAASGFEVAPVSLAARVLAAASAAALTGWLLTHVLHPSPLPPAGGAVFAGVAVALLPRLGWATLATTIVSSLVLQQRPGAALVLGVAALVPILVMPLTGWAWPLSAVAPALGVLGLAGAWPALAGRAATAWRRAALGLTGWLWLVVAEPLAGVDLYLGRAKGTPTPSVWTASLHETGHSVLGPLFSSGALAPAVVWAGAAVVLPWLVRGRSAALDLVRVSAWAAALVSATGTAIVLVGGTTRHSTPRGAVLGALSGAAVALAPAALALRRKRRVIRDGQARLP